MCACPAYEQGDRGVFAKVSRGEQGTGCVFAMTLRVSKCSRANAPRVLGEGVVPLFSVPLNT